MTGWLVRIAANACALAVATWVFAGIAITADSASDYVLTLLVVALLFGLVNTFVRPVVAFLSMPLYLLTLGLMFFVVNALMLKLTGWVAGQLNVGFRVEGFWTVIGGSVVISLVSWAVGRVLRDDD
jgi:putative membrane protein